MPVYVSKEDKLNCQILRSKFIVIVKKLLMFYRDKRNGNRVLARYDYV